MTDAQTTPTAAEWAATVLATIPRLTDEQWEQVNATLGVTIAPRLDQPAHPPRPRQSASGSDSRAVA